MRTCVCLQVRFSPQFAMTRSLVGGSLIGPVHYAEVDYFHNIGPEVSQYEWNLRSDGGGSSLLTAGCHALDGLMMFMDDEVTEVMSYATSSPHPNFSRYEYPTSTVTILRFAGGAVAKVASIVDSHQPYYLRVHLVGSEGTILDGKLWTKGIAGLDPDRWSELGVQLESLMVVDEPYLLQFQEFAAALDGDREMALTSLADAVRTFEVVFAVDRSAELGRPVPMTRSPREPCAAAARGRRLFAVDRRSSHTRLRGRLRPARAAAGDLLEDPPMRPLTVSGRRRPRIVRPTQEEAP